MQHKFRVFGKNREGKKVQEVLYHPAVTPADVLAAALVQLREGRPGAELTKVVRLSKRGQSDLVLLPQAA